MISLEKWMILAPLQKLPKNVEDLGKLIVAKGFKKLPKVQKIANSGHTGHHQQYLKYFAEICCSLADFGKPTIFLFFLYRLYVQSGFQEFSLDREAEPYIASKRSLI